jgi:hypothetical protein
MRRIPRRIHSLLPQEALFIRIEGDRVKRFLRKFDLNFPTPQNRRHLQ